MKILDELKHGKQPVWIYSVQHQPVYGERAKNKMTIKIFGRLIPVKELKQLVEEADKDNGTDIKIQVEWNNHSAV